ncbi:DUF2073 domain-containing protein [archaeon]|jgi:hypothetical protein|nr:DUF2073 domain-containing protein [archaeon]MBT3577503.1 DUF2073 domain-containing protein [archaeon]MBT6820473.1 DUF2073 domain-containing protein [archaeon]MBT6955659.1 DUF2073 domain-containing protein [archaeon]MBT7025723.1 DUF2073 domain-containing protein [archaeon]
MAKKKVTKKVVKKKSKAGRAKTKAKAKDLTIHFMPFSEIANEDTIGRIKKIMGLVLEGKVIILQGCLKSDEEARLIENSMTLIGNIEGFQGIELATVSGENDSVGVFNKIRHNLARILVGEQDAITIIGPASVVKDVKRDPKKMELMLQRR